LEDRVIRVLVVDRKISASELRRNLSKYGCIGNIAESGEQALRLIKKEEPDIVIMGASLPCGGDGLDMLSRVRILYPSLDVIMLVDERVG
jgi:two-component system, NtrC family, nitrogen regulation response regulator NtrX